MMILFGDTPLDVPDFNDVFVKRSKGIRVIRVIRG